MNFTGTAACYVFVRNEHKDYAICDYENNFIFINKVCKIRTWCHALAGIDLPDL